MTVPTSEQRSGSAQEQPCSGVSRRPDAPVTAPNGASERVDEDGNAAGVPEPLVLYDRGAANVRVSLASFTRDPDRYLALTWCGYDEGYLAEHTVHLDAESAHRLANVILGLAGRL